MVLNQFPTPHAISVIIPAYNEELYLPQTLDCLQLARQALHTELDLSVEIIVADNGSTDRTAEIAQLSGAKVISVAQQNIGHVRNVGASAATGELLIFVDADTLVPVNLLGRIARAMNDAACVGGVVDTDYHPQRLLVRLYLRIWRLFATLFQMGQGATQFCRRDVFDSLNGYDESLFMGEDVDFFWRLRRHARRSGKYALYLRDVRVIPSCRRFDKWPIYRILLETNPLFIAIFRRFRAPWRGWYRETPR